MCICEERNSGWLAVRASVHSAQELEFTLSAKGLGILFKVSVAFVLMAYSIVMRRLSVWCIQVGTSAQLL